MLFIGGNTLIAQNIQMTPSTLLNRPCPEFELNALDGDSINSKELLGDIVVLNFWFTGCASCLKEIKQLNRVAARYEGKDIHFIAITWEDDIEMLQAFSRLKAMKYKVAVGGQATIEKYRIKMYPGNVIIDQKGFVRFVESGFYGEIESKLSHQIDSLMQ